MIHGILYLWFVLALGSLIFLVVDLWIKTPAVWVMKLAWFLVILYTGPFGLFIYLLSCRQPLPGTHDEFIKAHWKQTVGSVLHCLSGDVAGIIIAAIIVSFFTIANGFDLIIEYVAGFACGLLIFQSLFMLPMLGGRYFYAIKKTFFAELVSMNTLMVGMFPTMLVLKFFLPEGREPSSIVFWGIMSAASIIGAFTAYPINSWMVRRGIKHGMISVGAQQNMQSMEGMSHPPAFSLVKQFVIGMGTFLLMVLAIYITSLFIPVRFS